MPAFYANYPEAQPKPSIPKRKVDFIAEAGQADSIREYGGVWRVHGQFLLEGAEAIGASRAEMIDFAFPDEYQQVVQEFENRTSIKVSNVSANFSQSELYSMIDPVEISLLFEVLLHQYDYIYVIENVINKTSKYVLVAQPVLKESFFPYPCGSINLQFYPLDVKSQLFIPNWFNNPEVKDIFTTNYWLWGQTASNIHSIFYGLGWDCDDIILYDLEGKNWDYALMRFKAR